MYMNILKEDKNYIYYEDDIFSKQRQRLMAKRYSKKHKCSVIGIVLKPYTYKWLYLKPNYHINL